MIETDVVKYLSGCLEVPCYMEMPEGMPDASFVLVEKTGSSFVNRTIYTAAFAFQSYAPTLLEAAKLNDMVKAAMKRIDEHCDTVTRSELNSDYNFTDTTSKNYRYQAIFDLTYYEEI